jgi:hypothetical protein
MSKENKHDIIDVPFTEVSVEEPQREATMEDILNLEDVGYMIVTGRYKNGETFFRTVGVHDLILILGLAEYSVEEVKAEISKHRK